MVDRTRALVLVSLATLTLGACSPDAEPFDADLDAELARRIEAATPRGVNDLVLPASHQLDAIPQDPKNPLTFAKVSLGKHLFHETALAVDGERDEAAGTYSCASCHAASAGFQAGRIQGIGEGGVGFGRRGEGRERDARYAEGELDVQPVRSPTVLNAAYQTNLLWNGQFGATGVNAGTESAWTVGTPKATNALGYEGMEVQAIAGLAVHRLDLDDRVLDGAGYRELFDEAFASWPVGERYTRETAGLAIAAYERTVLADRAPFQRYLRGARTAMADAEKRGAIVFFGDGDCVSCHSGPSLASMSFHALGMNDLHDNAERIFGSEDGLSEHRGRGGFTGRAEDDYRFKTPQLYNLVDSRFYGHGSSFRSVREVVDYKRHAVPQNRRVPRGRLAPGFVPRGLSDQQVSDLVEFLEVSLRDAELARYEPSATMSGNCFPNADALSRRDRGCE